MNDRERIQALPWKSDAISKETLEEVLRTPQGSMELRPIQVEACSEILRQGGLFGPIAVGAGKTLICALAPTLLEAKRPMLFTRAQLRQQMKDDIQKLREHWYILPNIQVHGYSELSLAKNADMLQDYAPDVIICDEAHRVLRRTSARTRRLWRYFMKTNPQCKMVAVSGTMTTKSIEDYWKLLYLSLDEDAPIPLDYSIRAAVAVCVDPSPRNWPTRRDWRIAKNLYLGFDPAPNEGTMKEQLRRGFRHRLINSEGVVSSDKADVAASLTLVEHKVDPPKEVEECVEHLRSSWEDPAGNELNSVLEFHRVIRQLAIGFYYEWVWPNGIVDKPWMRARNEWAKFVRNRLSFDRQGEDSPLLVYNATAALDNPPQVFRDWIAQKHKKPPPVRSVWVSDYAIQYALDWAEKQDNPSIIWYSHKAVGERLSQDLTTYGSGDAPPESPESNVVAMSIIAHGEGRNFQGWCSGFVIEPSSNAKVWEQLLGRTHRPGSKFDEVYWHYLVPIKEVSEGMEKARGQAAYIESTFGAKQKLLYADNARVGSRTRQPDHPASPAREAHRTPHGARASRLLG